MRRFHFHDTSPRPLRIVATEHGYTLLQRQGDAILTIAHVPKDDARALAWAQFLAATPLLIQALDDLVDHIQPDGWSRLDLEGAVWHNAFVALKAMEGGDASDWMALPD